jgi:osmotically-inducible protein OsmY
MIDTPDGSSTTSLSVSSLIASVRAAIVADPRLNPDDLHIQVSGQPGGVTIDGWVPRLRDRLRIGQAAEDRVGPGRVDNRLLVGPPSAVADAAIQQAVQDSLRADRAIDATSIQVQVHQGQVRLSGLIDTTMHRRYAGALCWWIPGVRAVKNDLTVIYPEPPDDELLAGAVQLVLEKDPLVDVTEILVLCHRRIITLAGTVGGAEARDAAEDDAWLVEDVRDVVNQIEVVIVPGAGPIRGLDG